MRVTSTLFVGALAATQVSATWDLFAKKYTNPKNYDNKCRDKQSYGFDWDSLTPGQGFDSYGSFGFKGFSCSSKFGKRDDLSKRTFQSKCITGNISKDKDDQAPSLSCDDRGFSINEFQISVDEETDVEFHYTMEDNSICKHVTSCSKQGTIVKNTQCGGAKKVTFKIPKHGKRSSCGFGIHHIDFDCNSSSSTVKLPTPTPTPTPSYGIESSTVTSITDVETPTPYESVPVETPTPYESIPVETPTPYESTAVESSSVQSSPIESTPVETPTPYESVPVESTPIETPTPYESTPIETPTPYESTPVEETPTPYESVPAESTTLSPSETESTPVPYSTPVDESPSSTPVEETPTPYESLPVQSSTLSPSETDSVPVPYSTPVESSTPAASSTPSEVESTPVPYSSVALPTPSNACVPSSNLPEVLPRCFNTWISSECKDNADISCYCKDADFAKDIYDCVSAWEEDDTLISQALSYFVGLCAAYVPQNPGLVTNCPGSVTLGPSLPVYTPPVGCEGTPSSSQAVPSLPVYESSAISTPVETVISSITPAPSSPAGYTTSLSPAEPSVIVSSSVYITTLTVSQTVTVPCVISTGISSGYTVEGSSTLSTYETTVTVPQVAFSTVTVTVSGTTSQSINVIPGTPAPVPASTTQNSGYGASSFGTITVPTGTATTSLPASFTGAASKMGSGSLMGAAIAAVVAAIAL